jgi:hypothetical protein
VDEKWARPWFAATALCVLVGIVVQLFVAADFTGGHFHDTTSRVLNVFVFFTIQSNLIVGVTTLLLALKLERTSMWFRVFRLMGLVGITVTGIVYHVAIRAFLELDTWGLFADQLLHTVVPILAVVGWLVFGPRGLTSVRVAALTVLFPLVWFACTLTRGAIIDWYPYTFIDVNTLGYLKVAINAVWIALLVFGLAAGATGIDGSLSRRRAADHVEGGL